MAKEDNSDSISPSPRELVVVMRPEVQFRSSRGRFESLAQENVSEIQKIVKKFKAELRPMFGPTEERVAAEQFAESESAPVLAEDLSVFYRVNAKESELDEIAASLADSDAVASAYVKPGAEPADLNNELAPLPQEAPPASPDFKSRQGYLSASPQGIDAQWAQGRAGGNGQNIRIIDIEGAWRFTHEDLSQNQGGVVGGTESTDIRWRNHGTAVLGEYSGDQNGFGITGICPEASASAISIFGGLGSAPAIRLATRRLRAGDIILIELHRPGPRHNFQQRDDQQGYIAIEWWEDDYAAILNATRRGIIVVEAAGNGAENLDDAIYQTRPAGFPADWTNSFRRSNRDSGAIVVGAGAPPPGTHGRNHGPDRSRLGFSNYGALIDAQGWGREVTTCGYGDLQGGSNEDLWYTDEFSGTSSASPIVVGAIGSLQGMAKARSTPVLTPAKVRDCLRSTGAAQQDAPGRPASQRIGNRPDLRQLYTCAFGPIKIKEIKEFKEFKEIKEIKEFKEKEKEGKELKEKEKDKEKDLKEFKELKEKELKEKDKEKELKEKDKDKDKDIFEKIRENIEQGQFQSGAGSTAGMIDQRIVALEAAIEKLTHFIGAELRPDLISTTRSFTQADELSGSVATNAKAAKDTKDTKDVENLS